MNQCLGYSPHEHFQRAILFQKVVQWRCACLSVWVCPCVFIIDAVLHYRWRTTVIQSAQFKIMDNCHGGIGKHRVIQWPMSSTAYRVPSIIQKIKRPSRVEKTTWSNFTFDVIEEIHAKIISLLWIHVI